MNRWISSLSDVFKSDAGGAGNVAASGSAELIRALSVSTDGSVQQAGAIDPNLIWAVMSNWRGFTRQDKSQGKTTKSNADPKIRVLLRAKDVPSLHALGETLADETDPKAGKLVEISDVYLDPKAALPSRFATGSLPRSRLMRLLRAENIEFELGMALLDQGAAQLGTAKGLAGRQTELNLPVPKDMFKDVEPSNGNVKLSGGTIAVFDYGCPFLRGEFDESAAGSVATRIKAVWHQQAFEADRPWRKQPLFGYGREMLGDALGRVREKVFSAAFEHGETGAYFGLNYLVDYDDPRRRVYLATHGAHVFDVVGGSPDPLDEQLGAATGEAESPPRAAHAANLIFVHMPEDTAGDSSGASLGVYLLDGLRYILSMCPPEHPLVVNVSYGSTGGPHDGTTMIEQAMDDLLRQRSSKFEIVLAAGNSRRLGLHAARKATTKRTALFRIHIAEGDRTDTFVEFWYPKDTANDLQFRVRLPNGDWSGWAGRDELVALTDVADSEIVATLMHRQHVPNGGRSNSESDRSPYVELSMALLALRPTEAPDDDDGPLAEPGLWEVEVQLVERTATDKDPKGEARYENDGGANKATTRKAETPTSIEPTEQSVEINAWIRRDDSRPFSGRVQSYFIGLTPSDADNTLSSIASGDHTVVVGGFRGSDGMPASYSSIGPRRQGQWPMVWGLCERDSIDSGIRAAAVPSQETFLMNGTSVAAPVVARTLYNLMSQKEAPSGRKALRDALRAKSKAPDARVRIDDDPGPSASVPGS